MVIGTSDGQVYDTEFHQTIDQPWEQQTAPDNNFDLQTHDNQDVYDYEAFKASGAKQAENGHYPDTFKKPNHITFSDESMYHGKDGAEGGHWQQLDDGKHWSFTPGKTNLEKYSPQQLLDYFKKYEPEETLVLPGS